jgi:poly-beta-1,6-N-acetyl-D-glucosamine N-deacetylase
MRLRERSGRLLATILLPLSIVPIVVGVPWVVDQYQSFARKYLDRDPLAAPTVAAQRWAPGRAYRDAVPVLVYHGINRTGGTFGIAQRSFAQQMAMLHAAGYHAISIRAYRRFLDGRPVRLPSRPVLITFDDSRLDSYRGADRVLQRYRLRATMFAITGSISDQSTTYLKWDELRAMRDSGRWDVQLHADRGHVDIPTGGGHRGPFYANFFPGETFPHYRQRVTADLGRGWQALREQLPGEAPEAYAAPFGDIGRDATNDPRIPRYLSHWIVDRFGLIFVQRNDPPFTSRSTPRAAEPRFEVRRATTTQDVYAWLQRRAPSDDRRE